MYEYPTFIWRPVPGGRHVFPVSAKRALPGEDVSSYCGAEVDAVELHNCTELAWIVQPTCMTCWNILIGRH